MCMKKFEEVGKFIETNKVNLSKHDDEREVFELDDSGMQRRQV